MDNGCFVLVPALQTTQREKAAPFLCGAGSVPAAMQLACCNAPCFHSVPHREPERFCRGFQQEQEQGQACFDTNRGQKPGQTQETISEHHKQSLPSSAEGGGSHLSPKCVASGRATSKICGCWIQVPVSAGSPLPPCPVQLDGAGRWVPRYTDTVPFMPRAMPTCCVHSPALAGIRSRASVTLQWDKVTPKYYMLFPAPKPPVW